MRPEVAEYRRPEDRLTVGDVTGVGMASDEDWLATHDELIGLLLSVSTIGKSVPNNVVY